MNRDRAKAAASEISVRDFQTSVNELAYYRVAENAGGFRIPAYLRRSASAPRLRRGPQLGGGVVAILTDPTIPCPMVYLVCPPNIAAHLWDFTFLGGTRVAVFHRPAHKSYAQQLAAELVCAGSDGTAISPVLAEGI